MTYAMVSFPVAARCSIIECIAKNRLDENERLVLRLSGNSGTLGLGKISQSSAASAMGVLAGMQWHG